jgi:hypothetical protein
MPGLSLGIISSSHEKGEPVQFILLRTLLVTDVSVAGIEAYQSSQSKIHISWMMWAFGNDGYWQ